MKQHLVETKANGLKIEIKAHVKGKNSSFEGWFCFDTGANIMVLPKRVLEEIGAEKLRTIQVLGYDSEGEGELYKASVECGEVKVKNIEILSSPGEHYLLGMNFITHGELGFFFDRKQIIWIKEDN